MLYSALVTAPPLRQLQLLSRLNSIKTRPCRDVDNKEEHLQPALESEGLDQGPDSHAKP